MAFCLLPKLATEFKARLKSGEIDPSKLANMTSAERRKIFSKFLGKDAAQQVNRLFESKLLLKNQQQGMITWAKKVSGMTPEAVRDLENRVNRMTEILDPKSEAAFLEDLASHKLGATVTHAEAARIAELSSQIQTSKAKIDPASPAGSAQRMEYGRSLVDLLDYVGDLKMKTEKLTFDDFKTAPVSAGWEALKKGGGLAKSIKASLDLSALFRQGLKVFFTDNKVWRKNAIKSFSNAARVLGGQNVLREVRAEILSRPNAINGLYKKEGLAVGLVEEAFPTALPEKIPVAGRAFKASQEAFTAFQYKTRADLFDKYLEIAQRSGADDFAGIGKLANSLTGRSSFGPRGESAASTLNNLFFSPRLLMSHLDVLTMHGREKGMSTFARKKAATNLVKIISGLAGVITIANALKPGSAELDPRSADFGKIKIGDTRFDIAGGMSSLVTLASRLATTSSKSSATGKVTKLNEKDKKGQPKFGAKKVSDLVYDFMENKLSPAASVVKSIADQEDFEGKAPTPGSVAKNLMVPLPITNYQELKNNPNSANTILALIADALGIGTNTYSSKKK